ncbi:MAG: hypothetical protein Q9O62_03660 [Ardenticatenia bacterium]|nr:hypothetical protein [Ardenticatenia bacterium]
MRRWHLAADPQQVMTAVCRSLSAEGWHVQRSFDLQVALQRLSGWRCPHHGTASCACSYIILLAHKPGVHVVPILIEGQEDWTSVDIPDGESCPPALHRVVQDVVLGFTAPAGSSIRPSGCQDGCTCGCAQDARQPDEMNQQSRQEGSNGRQGPGMWHDGRGVEGRRHV